MTNLHIHRKFPQTFLDPDSVDFEVVERKFRGHPDSMADMVAQSFIQKYIHDAWRQFPELSGKLFPNVSADKITLSGASTRFANYEYEVIKPVDALLIGKITKRIGDVSIDVDAIFKESIESILTKCLGHEDYKPHVHRKIYSSSLSGKDHDKSFYEPHSVEELISILKKETVANDTVYVVAYTPLSVVEKLSIYLDRLTASPVFRGMFPEIGSDIKAMIRRRFSSFEITMCLPIFPERVNDDSIYNSIIKNATEYIRIEALNFLKINVASNIEVELKTNTKDTPEKKYYAIWGTALSKGDVGAVGRGNRQQGFISGLRPSTNEAISGKNPNHFAGVIFQLVAENISQAIYTELGLRNIVYIAANNGDLLNQPNSIDVELEDKVVEEKTFREIIDRTFASIPALRADFINTDPYERFMCSNVLP